MPDLSACYFCGTALDEPLSEYPVVPKTLQPTADQQRTVVLCDGCRRKLGRVLDTVLEAVDERPVDATVQQGLGGEHEAVDEAADLIEAESETAADGDEADGGTADADVTTDEDNSSDATSDVSAAASATSGWSTVNVKHSNARRRSGSDDDNDTGDEAGDGASEDTNDDDGSETATDADDGSETATNADDGSETAADADDADERAGAGATEDQTLSRLEYSKVMRLLENREFPVDREEIRVVATNAYEIRPEEFDAIVDAAVKRGLLVEENGKFVEME